MSLRTAPADPYLTRAGKALYDPPAQHEGLTTGCSGRAHTHRSQSVGRIGSRRKGTAHLQQPGREGVLMFRLEIYRKQAKQLVRWHREGKYSIGGRIRGLARYRTMA